MRSKRSTWEGGETVDKNALRAKMAEHGETYEDLAKVIGCTVPTISDKINEKTGNGFTQPEIKEIKKHYNLTPEDIDRIFFGM